MIQREKGQYSDDKVVEAVRKLSDEFSGAVSSTRTVNKYDIATGTYYADESLARKKVKQPNPEDEVRVLQKRKEVAEPRKMTTPAIPVL